MQSTLLVNAGTLCCVIAAGYLVLSPAVIEPGGSLPTISPGLNQRAPVGEVKSAEAEDRECRDKLRQVGVVATTSTCPEGLDAIVAGLNKGRYWFNKLDVAHVAEAFPLTLKLQTSPDQIISFEGLPGTVEKSEPLRWARNLEATLSGDDFEILPSAPQQRSVTGAQPVEWNWTVKPKAAEKKC
jgi:hypothetical protein